ncbi:hypothetical protein B0O80DRAFT_191939 [Mortierella sp. GBAus27b]|nr:hypothetical protein B0O80DRAFT_191939 [Mortierella sp. GBAus27b]
MPAFPSALPDMWQPRAEPFLVPPKKTVVRISAPPPPTTNSAPGIKTLPARSSAPPSTLAPASSSTLLDSPAPEASGTSLLETTDLLTFQPSPPLRLPSLESSSPPVVPEGCLLPTFDPTSSSPTVEPLTIAPSNSLLKDDDSFWTTRSTGQGHTNIEPIVGQAKTLAIQDTSLSSEPSSITKAFSHPSQPPTSSSRISSHSTMSANKPSNSPTSSNPWQTFVEDADPDGTMDDGRGYVGGPRHYVDNPGRPSVRPNAPPPSQPQPRPPAAPTQPQPRPPAAPAQQPAKKPLAPAPRAPSPPRESTPQSRGFIQRAPSQIGSLMPTRCGLDRSFCRLVSLHQSSLALPSQKFLAKAKFHSH